MVGFKEKPEYTFRVSMGVYILNSSILDQLEHGKEYGFDNLMLDGLDNGLNIHSYAFDGYWLDIGRPDDYNQANEDFPSLRDRIL